MLGERGGVPSFEGATASQPGGPGGGSSGSGAEAPLSHSPNCSRVPKCIWQEHIDISGRGPGKPQQRPKRWGAPLVGLLQSKQHRISPCPVRSIPHVPASHQERWDGEGRGRMPGQKLVLMEGLDPLDPGGSGVQDPAGSIKLRLGGLLLLSAATRHLSSLAALSTNTDLFSMRSAPI